jgi:hypothetical protein
MQGTEDRPQILLCRTQYVIPSLRSWGTILANNTTTGVLGVLADGQVEVGVFHMIMTSRRMEAMDFSTPLLSPKSVHP